MLVIRRRAGESLLIGTEIEIEILEVESGQVKIGIKAPREVSVLRREIVTTAAANVRAGEAGRDRVRQLRDRLNSGPAAKSSSSSSGPHR